MLALVDHGRRAVKKLSRLRGTADGRLPSLGQDYDRGHRTYVSNLQPGGVRWLRTKPFSAPPSFELAACLHTFAHLVGAVDLGLRAQVLDVGCGPGWLSEFLARCGYWVTGIDISEEMIEIARERIAAIDGPVGDGIDPRAEFFAMPVREMPWRARFDAAILYDTMHHFDNELETLRVIHRALVPGGRIYIREGVRPPAGSESERNLIAEMEQHGTLEAPFEPKYLTSVLKQAGFVDVTRFMEIDQLIDVSNVRQAGRVLSRFARFRLGLGDTNTFKATKPVPPSQPGDGAKFAARLELLENWRQKPGDPHLVAQIAVTNTGRAFWPTAEQFPFAQGTVTVAPYIDHPSEKRAELPRTRLPRGLPPGEQCEIFVRVPAEAVAGRSVSIDLVREGLAWFSDLGSKPLVLRVED